MCSSAMETQLAWESFCSGKQSITTKGCFSTGLPPKPSPLYISTKTNIAYLSGPVDLFSSFWSLPVVPHYIPCEGIIKKQMKISSSTQEELREVTNRLPGDRHVSQHVIEHIDAVEGRIAFKDVRKICIGVCNKDVSSYRCKKRGAFYNCFSVIVRTQNNGRFSEMHVKVFNTGKLEIPGVQDDAVFEKTMDLLCLLLRRNTAHTLISWCSSRTETVLINSNFNTGFLIERDNLYRILRDEYCLQGRYDPCSYPGIQCDYYFTDAEPHGLGKAPDINMSKAAREKYIRMSFMVFRTGSVLIVGKCQEEQLRQIYSALCSILTTEYSRISTGKVTGVTPKRKKTQRLKTTIVTRPSK